jgi:hypothetical protein
VTVPGRKIVRVVLVAAFLLLLPVLAMQMSDEVAWSQADFAVAGILLLGTGLAYELAAAQTTRNPYLLALGVALATALFLIWINLAVGIIGSEDHPANVLYSAVLGVAMIGASVSRLEPRGMARTLFAMALTQALVPVIAMVLWKPPTASGVVTVVGVTAIFVALWVGSALLFRRASARPESPDLPQGAPYA